MFISVIVPVFNAEIFLNRCIESVINQSYDCIELLLINDGSTDNSEMICHKYAVADKRIKIISKKNGGPASARNVGVCHATGNFVFFLDADDFIEKNTFERLIEEYNQCKPDLVMSNFCKLENNGKIIKQNVTFCPDGEAFEDLIKELSKKDIVAYVRHFLKNPSNHLISYCWARLYKLSIIKKFNILANENMRLFEDFVFNLEYLKYTNEIVFVNESLYTYTMHRNHISASMAIINGESLLHDMNVFKEKANEFFQQTNSHQTNTFELKKEIGHALIHYVIIFLIRSCLQITRHNKKRIFMEISKIVNGPILKDCLQYYSPSKDNSRILPWLMKFKFISLIVFVCKHKAYQRYGKQEVG